MRASGVRRFVFSSTCATFGAPPSLPISEETPQAPINPYGRTKLMIEEMLEDILRADERWGVAILRYFNPVGAHSSGRIGEDPQGIPNNLMPYVAQVAVGRRPFLNVYGNDYPTVDGTGVRDYIHVVDLALGHLKALQALERSAKMTGCLTVNLGTGNGYSVLDIVKAFEQASGKSIPYQIAARRPGDIASCYADPGHALSQLGWRAERGLAAMCADAWRWQSANPKGYGG